MGSINKIAKDAEDHVRDYLSEIDEIINDGCMDAAAGGSNMKAMERSVIKCEKAVLEKVCQRVRNILKCKK